MSLYIVMTTVNHNFSKDNTLLFATDECRHSINIVNLGIFFLTKYGCLKLNTF